MLMISTTGVLFHLYNTRHAATSARAGGRYTDKERGKGGRGVEGGGGGGLIMGGTTRHKERSVGMSRHYYPAASIR